MKYRRGKGKEGVSGKESVEATESTELLQHVVFGRLLSMLHGGHGSASPNHSGATRVGLGSERGCVGGTMGLPVALWLLLGVVPLAHPGCAISKPGRELLQRPLVVVVAAFS